MSDKSYALLPYPFCGGKAKIITRGTMLRLMIVGCTKCSCKLESGDVYGLTDDLAWNRRAKEGE